jgi:hypothetical protein
VFCLQISVNGQVISTAGHPSAEGITAEVCLLPGTGEIGIGISGVAPMNSQGHDFLAWETPRLQLEDQVTIKVIESESPSEVSRPRAGEGAMEDSSQPGPVCFLCGKTHLEVDAMLSGRRGYVCKACIDDLIANYPFQRPSA